MCIDLTQDNVGKYQKISGLDPDGDVFIQADKVFRGIRSEKSDYYQEILKICNQYNLFSYGIIGTSKANKDALSDLSYEFVLEHDKIPTISYVHEWPLAMIQDAALFHINLFALLEKHGLTLKDWHPYNIVFYNTKPFFVDFTSIIFIDDLQNQDYLDFSTANLIPKITKFFEKRVNHHSIYLYKMYSMMYVPYFILPLYLLKNQYVKNARYKLLQNTMNSPGIKLSIRDVFKSKIFSRVKYEFNTLLKRLALAANSQHFFELLKNELVSLTSTNIVSGYSSYYDEKNENFNYTPSSQWNKKQHIIYDFILNFKPQTVLDIGCNTGWFSILSAKIGCNVVAIDLDESCINILYKKAKEENLSILPLVVDITRLHSDILSTSFQYNQHRLEVNNQESVILLLSSVKRLKSDCVMALAIVHHLVLGKGLSFSNVVSILSQLAHHFLILEFVDKQDSLIVEHQDFFPAYYKNPKSFEWYRIENLVVELRKNFKKVDVLQSCPSSRSMILCNNID
jgi:SAM-dependent methyltransferase